MLIRLQQIFSLSQQCSILYFSIPKCYEILPNYEKFKKKKVELKSQLENTSHYSPFWYITKWLNNGFKKTAPDHLVNSLIKIGKKKHLKKAKNQQVIATLFCCNSQHRSSSGQVLHSWIQWQLAICSVQIGWNLLRLLW